MRDVVVWSSERGDMMIMRSGHHIGHGVIVANIPLSRTTRRCEIVRCVLLLLLLLSLGEQVGVDVCDYNKNKCQGRGKNKSSQGFATEKARCCDDDACPRRRRNVF